MMLRAVAALLLGGALVREGVAQVPVRPPVQPPVRIPINPRDTATRNPRDTTRRDTGQSRSGLPTRPTRTLQAPDSVVQALLTRPGFRVTRYNGDSVQLLAQEKQIRIAGHVLLDREGTVLEADTVRYEQNTCGLLATGSPRLFDPTGVVVGTGMSYDACERTGIVTGAHTEFNEGSATWFLHGDFAVDNVLGRTYMSRGEITSCELPDAHYHFYTGQVKYVSRTLMVSRPAVLYVADVPIMWLPFVFQDMRRGRRSGIMPPAFGINDIVRNGQNYQRHIANIGYYWVLDDYADAQTTIDWYAQRFIALNSRVRYRWLDRFIAGGLAYQELRESGGSTSRRISWNHTQQFSLATQLNANLDYASSSRVISRNSVDPVLAVATIDSRLNFQHRYSFGTLALGGSRTQSLDKPLVSTTFPSVSFTPNPIALSPSISWSPSFSATNQLQSGVPTGQAVFRRPGVGDTLLGRTRNTSIQIGSPVRFGKWTLPNSFSITDAFSDRRELVTIYPDPLDSSQTLVRTYAQSYETGIDWNTGVQLPVLFQGTWNLAPSVSIVNTTGGPFLLRNRFTGGEFVSQGKRLGYSMSTSPTFFGRFGAIGPLAAMRHSISPSLTWQYSPAAEIPEAYARAIARGGTINRHSDPRQTFTFGLSQNFEGKLRPPPRAAGDTSAPNPDAAPVEGRKMRLLSIQSGSLAFDLEQAKKPGRNAWLTDQMTNTFSSDLLRGFSFAVTHDLWLGPVGFTSSRFQPALTSVTTGLQIGPGTLRTIGAILGLRPAPGQTADRDSTAPPDSVREAGAQFANAFQRGPLATRSSAVDRLTPRLGGSFSAAVTYNLQRTRPDPVASGAPQLATENQMIGGSVSFQPTRHWSVSWQTSYNATNNQFNDHVLRLDRDLHDWRATFTFVKSPTGNFLFSFFIQLIDQPEIKFDYDQRNIR